MRYNTPEAGGVPRVVEGDIGVHSLAKRRGVLTMSGSNKKGKECALVLKREL